MEGSGLHWSVHDNNDIVYLDELPSQSETLHIGLEDYDISRASLHN
jgi:hypothetical protein